MVCGRYFEEKPPAKARPGGGLLLFWRGHFPAAIFWFLKSFFQQKNPAKGMP